LRRSSQPSTAQPSRLGEGQEPELLAARLGTRGGGEEARASGANPRVAHSGLVAGALFKTSRCSSCGFESPTASIGPPMLRPKCVCASSLGKRLTMKSPPCSPFATTVAGPGVSNSSSQSLTARSHLSKDRRRLRRIGSSPAPDSCVCLLWVRRRMLCRQATPEKSERPSPARGNIVRGLGRGFGCRTTAKRREDPMSGPVGWVRFLPRHRRRWRRRCRKHAPPCRSSLRAGRRDEEPKLAAQTHKKAACSSGSWP
jgi:hypothetical protein